MTSTLTPESSVAENSIRWPPRGVCVEQATYGGQEAEVGHVVGLVEHGDLDLAEVAGTLLDQVLEATGAGDEDVDAGAERLHLRVLADAAEDGAGLETVHLGERREGCVDLRDQLAGRRQDQGARALRRTT